MPVVLGLDLGTTTITALALDTSAGEVVARCTQPNQFENTPPRKRALGFSEWDPRGICEASEECIRELTARLGPQSREIVGLAVTGQQHGVVLGDDCFVNWQDRRGETLFRRGLTFTARANELLSEAARERTGCSLATGYLALTLFWLREKKQLPADARPCFLSDYFASWLTNRRLTTDPTLAASSGVLDVQKGRWAADLIGALGLADVRFPRLKPAGSRLGTVKEWHSRWLGLPAGVPVFVGLGDNQASFLGSVATPEDSVLVNVGTGGQVSVTLPEFHHDPALETRPLPGGFLLVCAGLTGGRIYAVLKTFFGQVGREFFHDTGDDAIYETMNRLAATVPPGCDGLRCEPYFSGTRQQPDLRGTWSGISATNWTPAHVTRSLLEGMARSFKEGFDRMTPYLTKPRRQLIAAGNGMRENPLLRQLVSEVFGLPVKVPRHREEAAYGAALVAAVGAGIFPDLQAAAKLIRYEGG